MFAEVEGNTGNLLLRHSALVLIDAVVLKVGGKELFVLLLRLWNWLVYSCCCGHALMEEVGDAELFICLKVSSSRNC